jgi:hypothetical protein
MGRRAPSGSIIPFFAFFAAALLPFGALPTHALAAATAEGIALSASAGCTNANLDLMLTTSGATLESWQATTQTDTIGSGSQPPPTLANFSGTYVGFSIPLSPQQPPGTLIGAYAFVGTGPTDPANTAEFFVYYNCTTRQVLLSCFGQYGRCPQTAAQASGALAVRVPTLDTWALLSTMLVVAATGGVLLRRQR